MLKGTGGKLPNNSEGIDGAVSLGWGFCVVKANAESPNTQRKRFAPHERSREGKGSY